MTFNPDRHHRRSIRLKGYDYTRAGAYFVTICTRDRACLFGDVVDGQMRLNEMGAIARDEWLRSSSLRNEIAIDEWTTMPNHLHGIVLIDVVGAYGNTPHTTGPVDDITRNDDQDHVAGAYDHTPLRSPSRTLGAMVRGFKSAATTRINTVRNAPGVPVWQRNYYERIIRDDDELHRIRQYIADNPKNWPHDRENPDCVTESPIDPLAS